MQIPELVRFMRSHRWAVVATRGPDGAPQSAVVGIVVTERGEIVFDTAVAARKTRNLRADPRVSVVVGWDAGKTVQYEGSATELDGASLQQVRPFYFSRFPDGVARAQREPTTYFLVRPAWVRYSDFSGEDDHVELVVGD